MITVYSKNACTKCQQAKMFLDIKGVEYEVKMLGVDYELEEAKALAPQQREFPVILEDGVLVGGLEQLKQLLK